MGLNRSVIQERLDALSLITPAGPSRMLSDRAFDDDREFSRGTGSRDQRVVSEARYCPRHCFVQRFGLDVDEM